MSKNNKPRTRASGRITETVDGFRRTLTLRMPYDHRHSDPKKNFGIHGMDLRMVIYKNDLAIQFLAFLPVYLPHVSDELVASYTESSYNHFRGMGADVGYHSSEPQYEDQSMMDECDVLPEGKCYYDGSGLQAEKWYADFLAGGPDVIWAKLKERWHEMKAAGEESTSE